MIDVQCDIRINGRSISNEINPIIEELTTFDGTEAETDAATIKVADIEGQVAMADERDEVEIYLGTLADGVGLVFEGYVSDIRSRGSRSGGMTLTMECRSVDPGGKAKEPRERHWDDQNLGAILKDAFDGTGLETLVAPRFAGIVRNYEAMDSESPLAFAKRLGSEVNATVKAMGKRLLFVERNAGVGLDGIQI